MCCHAGVQDRSVVAGASIRSPASESCCWCVWRSKDVLRVAAALLRKRATSLCSAPGAGPCFGPVASGRLPGSVACMRFVLLPQGCATKGHGRASACSLGGCLLLLQRLLLLSSHPPGWNEAASCWIGTGHSSRHCADGASSHAVIVLRDEAMQGLRIGLALPRRLCTHCTARGLGRCSGWGRNTAVSVPGCCCRCCVRAGVWVCLRCMATP